MIHSWMLYGIAIALLLGAAAHVMEATVRERHLPVRAIWIAAILGSLLLPTLALLRPSPAATAPRAVTTAVDMPRGEPALPRVAAVPPAQPQYEPGPRLEPAINLDRWLLGGWAAASLLTLLGFSASAFLLQRRSRGWVGTRLDGYPVWIAEDTGPAATGFLRPRIVMPAWILDENEAERALILAHEDEHVRARDPHLLLGALLLLIALPWNVALWWQAYRLRQAIEVDCDRRVLARGVDMQRYSRLLLDVSERGRSHRLMLAALAESPSELERRIRAMMRRPERRWMPRLLAAAVAVVMLVGIACVTPRPVVPAQQSSLEQAIGQPMVKVDRRDPAEIVEAVMVEHFPQEYARAGHDDTLYLWFIAEADGQIERAALTAAPAVPTGPEQVLAEVFPDEPLDGFIGSGAGGSVTINAGSSDRWRQGPAVIRAHWWQRRPTSGAALDPHFMQHAAALSRQATIEALFPDFHEEGLEDGTALWVAFDDDLRLYRAWVGPDLDEGGSIHPSRDSVRPPPQIWDEVKAHVATVIPAYEPRGISRGGFRTRDGKIEPLVWIERAPGAMELGWR